MIHEVEKKIFKVTTDIESSTKEVMCEIDKKIAIHMKRIK